MSFFVGLYEGLLKAVIDESIYQIYKLEKIDEYKTGGGHDEIVVPECDCSTNCGVNCICRCHFHSCGACDKENCDFLNSCACKCHEADRQKINAINNSRTPQRAAQQDPFMVLRSNNVRNKPLQIKGLLKSNRDSNNNNNSGMHPNNEASVHLDQNYPYNESAQIGSNNMSYNNMSSNNMSSYELLDQSNRSPMSTNYTRANTSYDYGYGMNENQPQSQPYAPTENERENVNYNKPSILKKPLLKKSTSQVIINNDQLNPIENQNPIHNDPSLSLKQQPNLFKSLETSIMNTLATDDNNLKKSETVNQEEKEKIKVRRQSKYTQILNEKPDPIMESKLQNILRDVGNISMMSDAKKDGRLSLLIYKENMKQNRILKFKRSKSNAPKKEENEDPMNKKIDPKQVGLSTLIRTNFSKKKIKNLENPNNQEVNNDIRFIRDRTNITQGMNKLKEQIFLENYNDKSKLSQNVFDDFEKQTSWQSYTTLLITDIDGLNKEPAGGMNRGLTMRSGAGTMKPSSVKTTPKK